MATVSAPTPKLDRYIVIHVATTCDEHGVYVTKDSAEVIELGWILLDAKTCEEVCCCWSLIIPLNPINSPFPLLLMHSFPLPSRLWARTTTLEIDPPRDSWLTCGSDSMFSCTVKVCSSSPSTPPSRRFAVSAHTHLINRHPAQCLAIPSLSQPFPSTPDVSVCWFNG